MYQTQQTTKKILKILPPVCQVWLAKLELISKSFKWNLSVLISVIFLIMGIYLISDKVLFPVIYSYAGNSRDSNPVINPVHSINLSYVAPDSSGIKDFTFDELNAQAQKHNVADLLTAEIDDGDNSENRSTKEYFYLTIPKLDIYDAIVEIDSQNMDPKNALGHFKNTCLPGEGCNSFVYGHSSFKYFKNRYKEGDYSVIFSRLDELEYGDEFEIKYDGKSFKYFVDFSRVQNPEEVDPLSNPYPATLSKHESTVELFTCTPPGTTKYRLSVVGKLIE